MEKLKWITAEYTIKELLKPGGGVVVQRDILQRWKADNPGQEVRSLAGFKCNQQDKTVSIRIGVVDKTKAKTNSANSETGVVAKIEGKVPDFIANPSRLLQPGYDELLADNMKLKEELVKQHQLTDGLTILHDGLKVQRDVFKEKYGTLKNEKEILHDSYDKVVAGAHEDDKEFHKLSVKHAALVNAVSKDAQKFSATLVENENLKKEVKELTADPFSDCPHCVENVELKKQNADLAKYAGINTSPEAPDVQIGIKGGKTV